MDRFAGAFLVPGQSLREELGTDRHRMTCYEIVRLQHTYSVPAAALLEHLGQVGVVPPDFIRRAFATFARTWRKSEPEPIEPNHGFAAFEKPRRLKRLVSRALGEERILAVRAAALLDESLEAVGWLVTGPTIQ